MTIEPTSVRQAWPRIPFYIIQEIVWNYGAGVAGRRFFSPRNEKFLWCVKNPEQYVFNLDAVRDPDVKYPNQKNNGKLKCNPLGKKTICEVPSTLRAEQIEDWVLNKLGSIVATDGHEVETAVQRFIANAAISNHGMADAERIAAEIRQINDTVTALTMNIGPANLAMLNDRLTQLAAEGRPRGRTPHGQAARGRP